MSNPQEKNRDSEYLFNAITTLKIEREMKLFDITRNVDRIREIDVTLEKYTFQLRQIFID
jgi:hypothetical protein